ncbi:type II toxin-antitoxin system VapC family toxin [Brevundimonas sp. R86498]|uniref:type II toxin-antitoxin system VapC family toxin n=1 Tax=Brevundimonas sp. R86498 TaxID=3093845 RepID=UPI0037C9A8AB
MRAVDTNVLVRIFERDDPVLTAQAENVFSGDEDIFIANIVLCELAWVLRSVYRRPPDRLATILQRLMEVDRIHLDREAAHAGLAMLAAGADFSDGVVLHEAARARCRDVATFDRRFARAGAPEVVLIS